MCDRKPPKELLVARRTLDGLSSVLLLQDWNWNEQVSKWVLHSRIQIDTEPDNPIPKSTDWYVLVDSEYPWEDVEFYPAKENGLTLTFPHQSFNSYGDEKVPWRDGKICLSTSVRALGRHGYDIEPYDVHERLYWYFERAVQWLIAASDDKLVTPNDPFELPHFPLRTLVTVAFSEGTEPFAHWQNISEQAGFVELVPLRRKPDLVFVKSFQSVRRRELLAPTWGKAMTNLSDEPVKGIWFRLKDIPVLKPWQAPSTWSELRKVGWEQGIKIDELVKATAKFIRDGKSHIALIGFPIPAEVGGSPYQMHWQALQLPVLSEGIKTAKGFRTNEDGYWRRDRTEVLHENTTLLWANSENWHIDQISTRGRLSEVLTSKKILLLGAGAVGSAVAELLSRGNTQKITVVDSDKLEVGNLTRHTLDREYLKVSKAVGVANRLNLASPHATIDAINRNFPLIEEAEKLYIQQFEIILDCTGDDAVLHHLERFAWEDAKVFISISLGMGGKRLFCFVAYGSSFPHAIFRNMLNPWLYKEVHEYANQQLPREGIGCWHPVFPARSDDIWMMVGVAVKHIESLVSSPPQEPDLAVFEQVYENSTFVGVRRVYPDVAYG